MEIIKPRYSFDEHSIQNTKKIMQMVVPKVMWEIKECDFPKRIADRHGNKESELKSCRIRVNFCVAINDLRDIIDIGGHCGVTITVSQMRSGDWLECVKNLKIVRPFNMTDANYDESMEALVFQAEESVKLFTDLTSKGVSIGTARKVLSGNIAVDVSMTANIHDWYYVLSSASSHCSDNYVIESMMRSLSADFIEYFPGFFDDIMF